MKIFTKTLLNVFSYDITPGGFVHAPMAETVNNTGAEITGRSRHG